MILGIPMYGSYWFTDPTAKSLAPPVALAKADPDKQAGHIKYSEICFNLKFGEWSKVDKRGSAPYAYGDGKWVGYDTIRSTREKTEYAIGKGLGGVLIWELSQDDFAVR